MKTIFAIYVTLAGFLVIPPLGFFVTGHKQGVLVPIEKAKIDSIRVSKFLIEMAEARMVLMEEGRLAAEKGSTGKIKSYGRQMLIDQAKMMDELKVIAAKYGVKLPVTISRRKAKSLDTLRQKSGRNFDLKFIRMVKAVEKRDIILFRRIRRVDNEDVNQLSIKYHPLTEQQLQHLKQLRKEY